MTLDIVSLVLLAASLHAVWNAMVKSTGDRQVMMAWIAGCSSVIALPFAISAGVPALPVWKYLAVTVCIHTAYMLLLVRAYTHGEFGRVYPLARGVAPAMVAIAGFLLAEEALSLLTVLGICLVTAGIASLSWRRPAASITDLRGVGYAVATGVTIAAYSVVDGLGGRAAETPLAYTGWLFLINGVPFVLIVAWQRGVPALFASGRIAMTGAGGAALSMLAYGIVIWAMSIAPLGPVSALRETSVLFGALISAFVLKEGLGRVAVVAAAAVTLGVMLLSQSSRFIG